jgi:hypothetical protein
MEDAMYDQLAEQSWPAHVLLSEDNFVLNEVNPAELASAALERWRADKTQPKPQAIYRQWAKRLREQATPEAREVLRELMLETTVPFNELESPDFVDSYTGEPITDEDLEWVGRDDKKDHPFLDVNPWQEFLVTRVRESYADPEVAAKAMAASSEWVGVEDDELILEDRGYEPPTFSEGLFSTDELPLLRAEVDEVVGPALRNAIRRELERGGDTPLVQAHVRASSEARDFLELMQRMLNRGQAIQDVFLLIRPFTHALGLTEQDWATLKTKDARGNLQRWAAMYEDDINQTEEAGPLVHFQTNQAELEDIAEQFLQELLSTVPVEGDRLSLNPGLNPILRSKHYVEGFIRAQINGSENPALEAWRHWRKKTSPDGALAYDVELKKHGDRKLAMSAFWRVATKAGDIIAQPKRVAALKPTGLRLENGREISWSTACKIAATEGFSDQERLVETLKAKRWGQGLVSVIERQASTQA